MRSLGQRLLLAALVALALTGGVAAADPAPPSPAVLEQARKHFQAGRALYELKNFHDAAREFEAGYALVHKPQFLINLGQSYRRMGELDKARDMYSRFLDEAPPADPDRPQVQRLLDETVKAIAVRPPAPAPSPTPPAPRVEPQPAPRVDLAPAQPDRTPPPKRGIRKWWWTIPVAAVVAAGVGVGIYFAVRPAPQVGCADATYGCIDVGQALAQPLGIR